MKALLSRAGLALAALLVFAACGGDDSVQGGAVSGDITVYAASSLTDAFQELTEAFEATYPGTSVTFNFAASSALATQIMEGAPADVFAAANDAQMRAIEDDGLTSGPAVTFATNVPVVVVPAGSTAVATFEDLAKPGARLVLAGPEVPIGGYARDVLENAAAADRGPGPGFAEDVLANLQSNEANVRAVLAKVQLGEADAGIVYGTDAAAAGDEVTVIEIPDDYNVVAAYPIAALREGGNPAGAEAWIDFVLSAEGQAILREHGFGEVGR